MKSIRRILFASALFVLAFVSCTKVVEVETVTVSQTTAQLSVGDKVQLYATVLPSNAVNKDITWASSNHRVATITESGMVEAVAKGICEITAMAGGVVGKCAVTVTEVTAQSVTLSAETLKLGLGQTEYLSATVKPDNVTDKTISWASDNEDVATVTSEGKVTGHNVGHASITATCGIVSGACSVTVSTIDVESVTLDKSSVEIYIGESATLTATVKPDNATNKEVSWSLSNSSTVYLVENNDGSVTINAFGEGWVTITAQAGGVKATCEVHVIIREVTSVILSKTSLDLIVGQEETITAEVLPSNATYSSVSWKSTNTSVATVNNGKITALSEGTTIISAAAGGVTATCQVSVKEIKAESIVLNKTELFMQLGETFQLTAEVYPSNVSNKTITWASSAPSVVKVDNAGLLTTQDCGTAIIQVTCAGKTVTCSVSVYEKSGLCIEAVETGNIDISNPNAATISYSYDGIIWTDNNARSFSIRLVTQQAVYLRKKSGTLSYYRTNDGSRSCAHIACSSKMYISGNMASLLGGTNKDYANYLSIGGCGFNGLFSNNKKIDIHPEKDLLLPATTLESYCYENLFLNCSKLTKAPMLPALKMAWSCYSNMFAGCESLEIAPALPATTLANYCYESMFRGCTRLTTAPELPAASLSAACYRSMFYECENLRTAPNLPSVTLAEQCYNSMFYGCTSLVSVPEELPATSLTGSCYSYMYYNCKSLKKAPVLPAKTLISGCYFHMFEGCTNLEYMKVLCSPYSGGYTTSWVEGVPSSGTFVKKASANWPTGTSGIPAGWTVETVDE